MGYQTLESFVGLQDEELKLLETIRHSVSTRIKCERDYAASLLVVSICAQKSDLSEDIRKTDIYKAWALIAGEMESLSKLVNSRAELLARDVLELLDELVNEKRAMKRAFADEHNRHASRLESLIKTLHKTQAEYQKYISKYKSAKTKYEDLYMRLPEMSESSTSSSISKQYKKYTESKRRYTKVCQKLHLLHNEYCLQTLETNRYESDFRLRLIPSLLEYHDIVLKISGAKWKNALLNYVQNTDTSQDMYKTMQNRMRYCVESIINDNIYGELKPKYATNTLPPIRVAFNEKLLDECVVALKPNQLVIDTFTIDSLKKKESEFHSKLIESQKELRDKSKLLKNYEQEIETLNAISGDNNKAQNGIFVRTRAIDIIKKDIIQVEAEHERTHRLWEEIDIGLTRIAGIAVPTGLQLSAIDEKPLEVKPKSAATTPETSTTYSSLSWGRSLINKIKRPRMSASVSTSASTLTSCPSTVSGISSAKSDMKGSDGQLIEEDWFHGSLPRIESSKLLTKRGDFLVRKTTQNNKHCFVVSVLWNGFRHFIVNVDSEGLYKFEGPSFTSITDLIDYYQYNRIAITHKSGALLITAIPRERWELSHDDIELKEKIGRGNFGDVYKGVLKKTGTGTLKEMDVAIKTCKINLPDEQKRKFLAEGRILRQYNHPNIVQLIGICVHKQPVMIVMELVEGGSLHSYLRCAANRARLTLVTLMEMCIDTAAGMEYLEGKNCIHRDLAARNCLIGLPQRIVKISDFGMSREAPHLEYTVSDGMKQIPIKWTAPEALNYGRYTTLCDVWSYGILMWEIFTFGSTPYSGMTNAKARELIDNGYRLPCPPKTPESVYKIMGNCWQYEPKDRPHFQEIRQSLQEIYKKVRRSSSQLGHENQAIEVNL